MLLLNWMGFFFHLIFVSTVLYLFSSLHHLCTFTKLNLKLFMGFDLEWHQWDPAHAVLCILAALIKCSVIFLSWGMLSEGYVWCTKTRGITVYCIIIGPHFRHSYFCICLSIFSIKGCNCELIHNKLWDSNYLIFLTAASYQNSMVIRLFMARCNIH